MKPPIEFFVPGIPKPQARPRAFARNIGGKWVARVHDAGTAENWKSQIAVALKENCPPVYYEAPVALTLIFTFPRPQGDFTSKGQLKPGRGEWRAKKPDIDNLMKSTMDALTQLRVWADDALVCRVATEKRYGNPGCLIQVRELEDDSQSEIEAGILAQFARQAQMELPVHSRD